MKILQVNCVYQKGSTGKIVYDIHKCLQANGVESVVCYGRGKKINAPNTYKFCTEFESKVYHLLNKFGLLMYSVCPLATRKIINIIKKEKPDIVHLHCINGYCVDIYRLLKFLGQSNIKTIITHHAEFLYTGNCGHAYECTKFQQEKGCHDCDRLQEATGTNLIDRTETAWRLMKQAFTYFKTENLLFIAVSPWVKYRISLSPICNRFKCEFVTNGIETNIFHPVPIKQVAEIKSRFSYDGRKIILHVTASFTTDPQSIKGGYYIKQLAEKMPSCKFIVVANHLGRVEELPNNIFVWGRSNGQAELAALYTTADVTIITSKRETFSMIVAESLCCGTPVVGFKAGGPESIGLPDYTKFVEFGDLAQLKDAVNYFTSISWDADTISKIAAKTYSKEVMTLGCLKTYNELLK